jgi:hypothetical protein
MSLTPSVMTVKRGIGASLLMPFSPPSLRAQRLVRLARKAKVEAIHLRQKHCGPMDCFVASLLAMTVMDGMSS